MCNGVEIGNRMWLNVVLVYAPQVGRTIEEKEEFNILLGKVLKDVGENEKLIVCGDMLEHEQTGLRVCMVERGLVLGMLKERCG